MKKDRLLEEVRKLVDKQNKKTFIPGKTYIPPSGKVIDGDDISALVDASLNIGITEGPYTRKFEHELVLWFKNTIRNAALCNSGSSANLLAVTTITDKVFKSHRATKGSEVITSSSGFPTTLNPILQNNLTPVFVDVDLETFSPDPQVIENAVVEGKTKGIVLAHPLGNPYDAEAIRDICDEYGLWMVEDCADGLGSILNGKLCGSFGDLSTLSFYPAHMITSGEGGAVLTKSPMVKKVLESYRDWGRECWCEPGCENTCGRRFDWKLGELPYGYDHKYIYGRVGYNLKSTDLQASLLVSQLKKLDGFNEIRRRNWKLLYEGLEKFSRYFRFQKPIKGADPAWFGFAIIVKETSPFDRKELVQYLEEHKVGTRLFFGGNLLKQPAYLDFPHKVFGDIVNADILMRDAFWIGVFQGITPEMIEYMIRTISEFVDEHRR